MPKNEPKQIFGRYNDSPICHLLRQVASIAGKLLQEYPDTPNQNNIELQYARNLITAIHQLLPEIEALLQTFDQGKKPSIISGIGLMKSIKKTGEALLEYTLTRQGAILLTLEEKQKTLSKCFETVKKEYIKSLPKPPNKKSHHDHHEGFNRIEFQEHLYNALKAETIYYENAVNIPGNETPASLWDSILKQFIGYCRESTTTKDIPNILKSIEYELEKNHLKHQIMLAHPMLHEFTFEMTSLIKTAPQSLQELAPFFNPELLTLNLSILHTIFPFIPKFKIEIIPHEDPNNISYQYHIIAGNVALNLNTEAYYTYFQRHFLRYFSLFISSSEENQYWLTFRENAIRDIQRHEPEPLPLLEKNVHTDNSATQLADIERQLAATKDAIQAKINAQNELRLMKESYTRDPFYTLFRNMGSTFDIPPYHPILHKSLPSHLVFLKNAPPPSPHIEEDNAGLIFNKLPPAASILQEIDTAQIEEEIHAAMQSIQDKLSAQIQTLEQQESAALSLQEKLKKDMNNLEKQTTEENTESELIPILSAPSASPTENSPSINHNEEIITANQSLPENEISCEQLIENLAEKTPDQKAFKEYSRKLNNEVKAIQAYGETLPPKYERAITNLTQQLTNHLKQFLQQHSDELPNIDAFQTFRNSMIVSLHAQDKLMSEHRHHWKPLLANVAIGIMSVGIALGIKLIHSKLHEGRAMLFFERTHRQTQLAHLENSIQMQPVL